MTATLYGFNGKKFDPKVGLYDYGFRDYKPDINRWTTVDPIRSGKNWYAYVGNDPVNFVDPLGLLPEVPGDGTPEEPLPPSKQGYSQYNPVEAPEPQVPDNPSGYHCDITAWNEALNAGMDPRGQGGEQWNGNTASVDDIYDNYPNNRNAEPPEGTNGYGFYDSTNESVDNPTHMEYYDNTDTDLDTYTRYGTNGIDDATQTTRDNDDHRNDHWTYVPLEPLQ